MSGVSLILAAAFLAAPQLEGPESLGPEGLGVVGQPGDDAPKSLGDVMTDDSFFDITNPAAVKAGRPPTRNPFLLPQEQQAGRSLSEIRKAEEEAEAEAEKARMSAAASIVKTSPIPTPSIDHARVLIEEYVKSLALTAVLISDEIQTAVVNGDLIDRGEVLPGTAMVVSEIHREGIRLTVGEHHIDLRLPPPGRTQHSGGDTDDSGDESDAEQDEGQEEDASDTDLFDTAQEG